MNEREIVKYPKIKHIRVFLNNIKYRGIHIHYDYEFCFALQGNAKYITANKIIPIKKGEIVFINSGVSHSIESEDNFCCLIIQISRYFLHDYFIEIHQSIFDSMNLLSIIDEKENKELFNEGVETSREYFKENKQYRMKYISFVLKLFNIVFSKTKAKQYNQKQMNSITNNSKRFQDIFEYIDEHFQEKISLMDIAKRANISITHLSHLFKEFLGINFQTYLNEKRLDYSARLIRNKEKNITDIAYEAGFSDPKYLTKLFKEKYNMLPRDYQKINDNNKLENNNGESIDSERVLTNDESIKYLEDYHNCPIL